MSPYNCGDGGGGNHVDKLFETISILHLFQIDVEVTNDLNLCYIRVTEYGEFLPCGDTGLMHELYYEPDGYTRLRGRLEGGVATNIGITDMSSLIIA